MMFDPMAMMIIVVMSAMAIREMPKPDEYITPL